MQRCQQFSSISALIDSDQGATHLAEYTYLGLDQWLEANHAEPGVKLTYLKQSGESDGDAGDQYAGLDRFGRIVDQRWLKTGDGTAREPVQFGYDRANNRQWRLNVIAEALTMLQDEYYTYDGLYQFQRLKRGTLNQDKTDIGGNPAWQEDFAYDPTGNWHGSASAYVTRIDGQVDLDQNRAHNPVNEITEITRSAGPEWATPDHDHAGNMIVMPQPDDPVNSFDCLWDAWNRLVQVSDTGGTVAAYAYDGLTRRITKTIDSTTRHFYYSDKWQVLEERLGTSTDADRQFVWGLRHLDDLIVRDWASGSPTRLYALQDALSVTAVVNTSGAVQERYGYDGFGTCGFLDDSFFPSAPYHQWETLFHCYRWDAETALNQVRYRYLHPGLGRWVSRDPIDSSIEINLFYSLSNNPQLFRDVLGESVLGDLWDKLKKHGDPIQLYSQLKAFAKSGPCPTINKIANNDSVNCICGILAVADVATNAPPIEGLDCICNVVSLLSTACSSGVLSFKTLAYGFLTYADCISVPVGAAIGFVVGSAVEPGGGSVMGTIIGLLPASTAAVDLAAWACQNVISQGTPLPMSQGKACSKIINAISNNAGGLFASHKCDCSPSMYTA